MPSFRRFLTRRWLLAVLGGASLLFGLAMLHPYPRQSLFGPKIDGVPWCVWENKVRRAAAPDSGSFLFDVAEKIGLVEPTFLPGGPNLPQGPELLPLYLHLANDDDVRVRRISLRMLQNCVKIDDRARWAAEGDAEIWTVIRRHVDDSDAHCQVICADYLWRALTDRSVIKVTLAHCDHGNPEVCHAARRSLCYMAPADVDASFGLVAQWAEDTTQGRDERFTRLAAIRAMQHFGKRGFPVIRKALADPDREIQFTVLRAIQRLRVDAQELKPDLVALRMRKEPYVRITAEAIVKQIDEGRIPAPKLEPE